MNLFPLRCQIYFLILLLIGCRENFSHSSLPQSTPQGRWALGIPLDNSLPSLSPEQVAEVRPSFLQQRRLGWEVAASVWLPKTTESNTLPPGSPRWLTWYDRNDIDRLFAHLYEGLGREGRHAQTAFSETALDEAESWLAHQATTLSGWDAEKLQSWLKGFDTTEKIHGLVGLNRTLYNRSAARHILKSYPQLELCFYQNAVPPPDQMGQNPADFAPCLASEFPPSATIIKAVWKREDPAIKRPIFATDAQSLIRQWQSDLQPWTADRWISPQNDGIFTIETPEGNRYQLTGSHIMTKIAREWVWTTLWWSESPHQDFGEDRSGELPADSPLLSYKMCTIVGFANESQDIESIKTQWPTLGAALAASQTQRGSSSWCSNPYIEEGAGNQSTNCIGCHQHGGIREVNEQIFQNPNRYPDYGRTRLRQNFPTDYLWSLNKAPENLAAIFHKIIDYYKVYDNLSP